MATGKYSKDDKINNKKPKKEFNQIPVESNPEVYLNVPEEFKSHVFTKALENELRDHASFTRYEEGKGRYRFVSNEKIDKIRSVVNVYEQAYRIVSEGFEVSESDIEFLIKENFKNTNSGQYDWNPNAIFQDYKGKYFTPRTENQRKLCLSISTNIITIASGKAGTGKSTIALIMALNALRDNRVDNIKLIRPMVAVGGDIGFLPGSAEEKNAPFSDALRGAVEELIGKIQLSKYVDEGKISFMPISFIRGCTLENTIIIGDEVQNLEFNVVKSLITRIGVNAKMILTGDESQRDLQTREKCSLIVLQEKLRDIENIGIVNMGLDDIQRSYMVKKILEQFD